MKLNKMEKRQIIKALCNLEPGNADDFLIVEIGEGNFDALQAAREANGEYHIELLLKGGDPELFNGERIISMDHIEQADAVKFFLVAMRAKDTTQAAARAQK